MGKGVHLSVLRAFGLLLAYQKLRRSHPLEKEWDGGVDGLPVAAARNTALPSRDSPLIVGPECHHGDIA